MGAFDFVNVHGQFHTLPLNSMAEGNFIQSIGQILYTIADSGSCHFVILEISCLIVYF